MPHLVSSRVEDMAIAEGRPSMNVINSVFSEPEDYSNVLNECEDEDEEEDDDDDDPCCSPEDDARCDGIVDWNEQGIMPENNQIINMNGENLEETSDTDVAPELSTNTRAEMSSN